jgi:uncharacterized protein YbjT (DUF2867 family)
MNILIAGSTGLVGEQLTALAMTDESVEHVYLLQRKPMIDEKKKCQTLVVDFDQLKPDDLPENLDAVICCLGTTIKNAGSKASFRKVDYGYVTALATHSAARGAKKFICLTAMGADPKSVIFYNRVKGETEDFLVNDTSFKDVVILRPSLLLGKRKEQRIGEQIGMVLMQAMNFIFIGGLRKYKAIPAITVAKALLLMAKLDDHGKKILLNDAIFALARRYSLLSNLK